MRSLTTAWSTRAVRARLARALRFCSRLTRDVRPRYPMRIVLARHGKPSCLPLDGVAPCDIGKWIEAYNEAGVIHDGVPPQTIEAARSSAGAERLIQLAEGNDSVFLVGHRGWEFHRRVGGNV